MPAWQILPHSRNSMWSPGVLEPYGRDFACTLHGPARGGPQRLSRDPEVRSVLITLAVTTTDIGPEGPGLIMGAVVAGRAPWNVLFSATSPG